MSCNLPSNERDLCLHTGVGGATVPDNVIWVDPSVMSIPARAFEGRKKVKLSEGLVKIGGVPLFNQEDNIPNSLRRIKDRAFDYSLRTPIRLHDGIESIRVYAFSHCIFSPTLDSRPSHHRDP